MFTYTLVVISLVIISSAILSYKFNKISISNLYIVVSTAISSIVIGEMFPYIFLALFDTASVAASILSLLVICIVYIILVILFTYLISIFILRLDFKPILSLTENNFLIKFNLKVIEKFSIFSQKEFLKNNENCDDEKLEQEAQEIENLPLTDEKNDNQNDSVIVVDFKQENGIDDSIDKAFILMEKGDYEEAILHFKYALDQSPQGDTVFWIVLNICSIYKTLGQAELANDILASYSTAYSNIVNESIRTEIERNLI